MEYTWFCKSPILISFLQSASVPAPPAPPAPSQQGVEELSEAVATLNTLEEVMKYLEPERWQLDMEELYKPTWHLLGKSFIHTRKARGITFFFCKMDWHGSLQLS